MISKEKRIVAVGRWKSLPTEEPKRLEGDELFQALRDDHVREALTGRELTVHVEGGCYPRLRLKTAKLLNLYGCDFAIMRFGRWDAPWEQPLRFCCGPYLGAIVQQLDDPLIALAITVGYPTYRSEWVVDIREVA